MSQVTTGLRSVLSHPVVYQSFARLIGGDRARARLIEDHIRAEPGTRVLDVGCGPGTMFEELPEVAYVGIDISDAYIEHARERYGDRAEFRVGDGSGLPSDLHDFDLVLAIAVLHHLDDDEAHGLLAGAAAALKPEGRLVTLDCVFTPDQNRVARAIIERDRGQHVRTEDEYVALAEASFGSVRAIEREDLLRVPYTHLILECTTPHR